MLPSTLALFTTTLGYSFAMSPPSSTRKGFKRTLVSTSIFAFGAIAGWPFALALAIPYVFEQLIYYGDDHVNTSADFYAWIRKRWIQFAKSVLVAALLFVSSIFLSCVTFILK